MDVDFKLSYLLNKYLAHQVAEEENLQLLLYNQGLLQEEAEAVVEAGADAVEDHLDQSMALFGQIKLTLVLPVERSLSEICSGACLIVI